MLVEEIIDGRAQMLYSPNGYIIDIIRNKKTFHEGHEFSRKTKRNSCFFVNFVDKK
jgi:hypothetical protein